MANVAKQTLQDKDIRNLEIKSKQYIKAVSNPKELYLFVHPSGTKTFFLRPTGGKIVSPKGCPCSFGTAGAR
nr:hypothetical protein [uncultured Campylobacter sp.]